jgi:predicted transcriptional regulator
VKTHLIQECGLKAATAEKYLSKLVEAKYIESYEEDWGERSRTRYRVLPLGVERYSWFLRINAELDVEVPHER